MSIYVNSGFAAVNLASNPAQENRWIGIIQGNIYCKKVRKTAKRALKDAEKLFTFYKLRK